MAKAVKTRRLSDLYRRGKETIVTGDDGEEVAIWLQKLNPIENESAVRSANAARARIILEKGKLDSDTYLSTLNEILEYSFEDLVEYLSTYSVATRSDALEAEYAEEKKWTKEDYLQGLHDAWEGSLKVQYEEDPEDEEAAKCKAELDRYDEGLSKRLEQEREVAAKGYQARPRKELEEMIIDQIYKLQADMQWMVEYHKQELYFGIRDPEDHKQKYFAHRDEVDELESEVVGQLLDAYAQLEVSVTQGKDSQESQDSSSVSKPLEKEMEDSSGLKE